MLAGTAARRRWAPVLLAALLLGFGMGYLLARAAAGAGVPPGGRAGSAYEQGYQDGWRDGYDQGYAASCDGPLTSPAHALTIDQARAASAAAPLAGAIHVAQGYRPSRQYEAGVYDCNDMAVELWTACRQAGVPCFLVVGNTGMDGEAFADCDHCWVVLFCAGQAAGQEVTLAVDPQAQLVGTVEIPGSGGPTPAGAAAAPGAYPAGGPTPAVSAQYAEGFFYADPAGLRADLGTRW